MKIAEDDPINLQQALQSSNSHKWIDAMKEEMKSMETMTFGILLNCLNDQNPLVVNGYSKLRGIQMAMSKDIKLT